MADLLGVTETILRCTEQLRACQMFIISERSKEIRDVIGFEILDLEGSSVGDSGLPYLMNMRKLKIVSLPSSNVTADGRSALRRARPDINIREDGDDD
jgi:hypothetical protein